MSDFSERLSALSLEQRALLEKKLREKQKEASTKDQYAYQIPEHIETHDVIILGGGLAGLTLALQLKQTRPQTQILVVEKHQHPVPEAAFKVGESTVEIGAHYLGKVLNLREHIEDQQLIKFGLRYFLNTADKHDITQRPEMGASFFPPAPSYQLDRGRFENALGQKIQNLGVRFLDNSKVKQVVLEENQHFVVVQRGDTEHHLGARWVVDATGRTGLLKRKLGLERDVTHKANAAWFRIDAKIDIEEWSDDSKWHQQIPPGLRWLSTNHLMGKGYWVWLIPLPADKTSVGIVTDAKLHPFNRINRRQRAMAWLQEHEPQCAQKVGEKLHLMQDFHVLKHYAYGCTRVFSAERWCLTGEAGVFTDPFYSPGTDFIGVGNTLITDLIVRDFQGESISERVEFYNQTYFNIFETFLAAYDQQYPLMDNPQVMAAKVVWDFGLYWAFMAPLFFHNKYCDLAFMSSIARESERFVQLSYLMQRFFREWSAVDKEERVGSFIDLLGFDFLLRLNKELVAGFSDDVLRRKISANLILCENLAVEMFRRASRLLPESIPDGPINPYAISLNPEKWQEDGLFDSDREAVPQDFITDLSQVWLDPVPVSSSHLDPGNRVETQLTESMRVST
jgi:flavin-dependent dehydrogenase